MANIPNSGYRGVVRGRDARVWIWEGVPTAENCPQVYNCLVPGSVSYSQPTTAVRRKCAHPTIRGKFITSEQYYVTELPEISGSIQARLPAEAASLALRLTKSGCDFTMLWAFSSCGRPDDLAAYDRLEVFENVRVTNYNHDEVGAFSRSAGTDDVLESIDFTALYYYEVTRPELILSAPSFGAPLNIISDTATISTSCFDKCDSDNPAVLSTVNAEWSGDSASGPYYPQVSVLIPSSFGGIGGRLHDRSGNLVTAAATATTIEMQRSVILADGDDWHFVDTVRSLVYSGSIEEIVKTGTTTYNSVMDLSPAAAAINHAAIHNGTIYVSGRSLTGEATLWSLGPPGFFGINVIQTDPTQADGREVRFIQDGSYSWVTTGATAVSAYTYDKNHNLIRDLSGDVAGLVTVANANGLRVLPINREMVYLFVPEVGVYSSTVDQTVLLKSDPKVGAYSNIIREGTFIYYAVFNDDTSFLGAYMSPDMMCSVEEIGSVTVSPADIGSPIPDEDSEFGVTIIRDNYLGRMAVSGNTGVLIFKI